MKRYQTRMGLAVGLAVVGMPLTVNAQPSRSSLQPRQPSPLEQANELNQPVIERYQAGRYQEAIPLAESALAIPQLLAANRQPDVTTSLNNLVGLLSTTSGSMFPVQTSPSSPQLAQVTPNTATGQLDETSDTLEDGSYFNVHTFEGKAGESITIELVSRNFDTVLALFGPDEQLVAGDDNSGDGNNSRLTVTLPTTGTHTIVVFAIPSEGEVAGQYTLTWNPATAADVTQAEARQRAASLNQQLVELYQAGRYQEAIPLAEEALSISREQLGNRHPNVAASLNNLAGLYQAQGRYREAESLYQESLSIRREQLGERHPNVASNLSNLATLYQAQGRYGEAEPLYQESLSIRREQLGERHPDVAISLNNLADLYRAQGRYGEADPLAEESLSIWREQLGERHPNVAASLNNLAELYRAQGRYGEVEPRYQESLSILREQLGERHPDVASSLNNLALFYQNQGRFLEAELLYQESLSILREQLGERHPNVASSLNNLAELYRFQGRYREAGPLYQESLAILREQFGNRHPDVAINLNNLAGLYHTQDRYGEAEPLYQEALAIKLEQFGNRHPSVATSLNNLTLLYQAQGNIGMAVSAFQAGLEIQEWNLDLNLATLTDAQRQDYAATLAGTTNGAISLSLQATETQPLGLTTLLRRKGRLLEAGSRSLQRLRQNLTPADQMVLDDFIAVRQQLAALTFNPPARLSPQQYRAQLAQLEAQATDLEKTLGSSA